MQGTVNLLCVGAIDCQFRHPYILKKNNIRTYNNVVKDPRENSIAILNKHF